MALFIFFEGAQRIAEYVVHLIKHMTFLNGGTIMLTANYRTMIFEPHVRLAPKKVEGASTVYAVSSNYGKFTYRDMLDLATKGKVPMLAGTYRFSEEWCKEFCKSLRAMGKRLRKMLHTLDQGELEKSVRTAIAILNHERMEFVLCYNDSGKWKYRPFHNALQSSVVEYAKILAASSKCDCRLYKVLENGYEPLCQVMPSGNAKYDAKTMNFLESVRTSSMGEVSL